MRSSIQFVVGVLLALVASSCAFQSVLPSSIAMEQRYLQPLAMSSEDAPTEPTAGEEEDSTTKPNVVCPDCDMCDGSGRIAGGIGAVLPFVPIKAYRPCPRFVENGGNYQRAGQGLDEIAFGKERGD